MGASGPSTGGGGGVGPAGRKTDGTYGTKKDARKASRRNELRTAVKKAASKSIVGKAISGLKKASKKSKQNVLDYEGQAAGVTPMRNPINQRDRESDNLPTLVTASNTPPEPIIIKKNIGGTDVQTTDVKLAEEKKKIEEDDVETGPEKLENKTPDLKVKEETVIENNTPNNNKNDTQMAVKNQKDSIKKSEQIVTDLASEARKQGKMTVIPRYPILC